VLRILPYLLKTDEANIGGRICFVFFGLSLPISVYLYFCLPELEGRTVAEIQEMFQAGLPARKFEDYVCQNDKMPVAGKASIQAQAEGEE
jgi:hypothetical protein